MTEIQRIFITLNRILNINLTVSGYTFSIQSMIIYFGCCTLVIWFLISWFHSD